MFKNQFNMLFLCFLAYYDTKSISLIKSKSTYFFRNNRTPKKYIIRIVLQ